MSPLRLGRTILIPLMLLGILIYASGRVFGADKEGGCCPSAAKPFSRVYDPVEIGGKYFKSLRAAKVDGFALYSFHRGQAEQMPMQIDERTPALKMELNAGKRAEQVKGNGVFDPQDNLVFMAASAGERAQPEELQALGPQYEEIALDDPVKGGRGYVYLLYNPDRPFPKLKDSGMGLSGGDGNEPFAVRGKTFIVRGRVNNIRGKTYQTPVYKDWLMLKEAGGTGLDVIDGLKIRIRVSFLFGTVKLSLNEGTIVGGVEAMKVGPVRGYGRYWVQVLLPMGLKSPKGNLDVYIYDHWVLVPTQMKVFMNPGYVMSDFYLSFGYNMNKNAKGMKFYNSNNREGFLIDGQMDEKEKAMDHRLDTWRAVVGPQGTIVTASVWDEPYKKQAKITIQYQDNEKEWLLPTDDNGCIGYHYNESRISTLAAGTYNMLLCWFYPPNIYDPARFHYETIEDFLNVLNRPIQVTASGETFNNPGGWPPFINPHQ